MELPDTGVEDIDGSLFKTFYEKRYGYPFDELQLPLERLLHNMNLSDHGHLNIAGLMLFGKDRFVGRNVDNILILLPIVSSNEENLLTKRRMVL